MSENGLSEDVSNLLRCPVTQQALHFAKGDALTAFDSSFPEGAYLTEDGQRAYPVEDGFPNLVPNSASKLKG